MWIRHRLDIGWADLLSGLVSSVFARDVKAAAADLEAHWANEGDGMSCLSVRTGLDLLLTALDLPLGSEVLFSAVTIPDMLEVARAHRLAAVPVDVVGADLRVDVEALRAAITPQSRVLVIAHLFGARPELTDVLRVAREAGLFVVEDCAQAWCGPDDRGDARCDASLFSFGSIKSATALGGALLRIGDRALLRRMRDEQSQLPVERQRHFAAKVVKTSALRVVSTKLVFAAVAWWARRRGANLDSVIGGMTRGFADRDLMKQLRQRPCAAKLRLLKRRLKRYDRTRIERRITNARGVLAAQLGKPRLAALADPGHSFWLLPYQHPQPQALIDRLRDAGVDSTRFGSLRVVAAPAGRPELSCGSATRLLDSIVFLPCYAELPESIVERMRGVLQGQDASPAH